jgi:hypothetical protein
MDWQAAIEQMAAMMSLVWMFTGSPFILCDTGIVSICFGIYHSNATVAMFFWAAASGLDGNSASACKPRKMTRPPARQGRR